MDALVARWESRGKMNHVELYVGTANGERIWIARASIGPVTTAEWIKTATDEKSALRAIRRTYVKILIEQFPTTTQVFGPLESPIVKTPGIPTKRSLSAIARDIRKNWPKVYYTAIPYVNAMMSLDSINDVDGFDSARDIVLRFLGNAATWRGPDAKRIKAELKAMLK